ncbi:MAG: hypothetical protein ACLSB9_14805 [Hydrogeniiclostridium mannosilyticum]
MGGAGPYYLAKAPAARAWEIPHQAGEKGKAIGEDSVPKGQKYGFYAEESTPFALKAWRWLTVKPCRIERAACRILLLIVKQYKLYFYFLL